MSTEDARNQADGTRGEELLESDLEAVSGGAGDETPAGPPTPTTPTSDGNPKPEKEIPPLRLEIRF